MNKVNWTQVGVFAIVVLLVVVIGVSLLGSFGGYGMMGRYGMMGHGTTFAPVPCSDAGAGVTSWGFPLFGWLGMLLMWLVPLGFLALLVVGIVWLARAVSGPSQASPPTPPAAGSCPSCGRPTQADWQHCPYCGQSLT